MVFLKKRNTNNTGVNMDIDMMVESWADSLNDARYSEEIIECHQCKEMFSDYSEHKSDLDDEYHFCSQDCVNKFEEENKDDYE